MWSLVEVESEKRSRFRTYSPVQESGVAEETALPAGRHQWGGRNAPSNDRQEPIWLWVLGSVSATLSMSAGHSAGVFAASVLLLLLVVRQSPAYMLISHGTMSSVTFRVVMVMLAGYLVALCFVRTFSFRQPPPWSRFPESCTSQRMLACTHLSETVQHRTMGLDSPIRIQATRDEARIAVLEFAESESLLHMAFTSEDLVHARVRSFFMGYIDDMAVKWVCDSNDMLLFDFHSESQLGVGDDDSNGDRLKRFARWSQRYPWSGQKCV